MHALLQGGYPTDDLKVGPSQEGFVRSHVIGPLVVLAKVIQDQVVDVL